MSTICSTDLFASNQQQANIDFRISSDYDQLSDFARQFTRFCSSEENFEAMFWKGLRESISFYDSSSRKKRSYARAFRKLKQLPKKHFKHPFNQEAPFQTNATTALHALRRFAGQWHGFWKDMTVHHLWLPIHTVDIALQEQTRLLGFQSCFTGDGFGWNYLVQIGDQTLLLGFVYHFDETGALYSGNPHIGFVHRDLHLTWISYGHLYNEHVCTHPDCELGKHYVITSIKYTNSDQPRKTEHGFQAIYLSKGIELPLFQIRAIE